MNVLRLWRRCTKSPAVPVFIGAGFVAAASAGYAAAIEEWLVVGAIAALGVAPLLLRWPVVATVGLYAFMLPFEALVGVGGGASAVRYVGMLAAGALLVVGLNEKRLVHPPSATLWWGALVLWGGITTLWALRPEDTIHLSTSISLFMLFLVATSFRISATELNVVCLFLVAGGAAAGVAGYIFGVQTLDAGGRGSLDLQSGAAVHANMFGESLLPAMAFAMAALLHTRSAVAKALALSAIAALAAGIYVTISRASLLGLTVVIAFSFLRGRVRSQAFLVAAVLLSLLMFMPEHFFTRVMAPFTGDDPTGSGRVLIWQSGVEALNEFWAWGAGLSNFQNAYARYAPTPPKHVPPGAHNLYLGAWIELGIVGIVILAVAISAQLLLAGRARKAGSWMLYAAEAAFVSELVVSFFSDNLYQKRFWMAGIMLIWAARTAEETATEGALPQPTTTLSRQSGSSIAATSAL